VKKVYSFVLCGGRGIRLGALTDTRAKPAVPFGGKYRIVDFVMSNLFNSGFHTIGALVQYRSQLLMDYISNNWSSVPRMGFNVYTIAPQQVFGEEWYRGTADAVYQNLDTVRQHGSFDTVCIMSGDHITAIDLSQMYQYHQEQEAVFTVCAMSVPSSEAAGRFGVIEVDVDGRIIGFEEKPEFPKGIPGKPGVSYISLGNYFADFHRLASYLGEDANATDTDHDFGKDIIPQMVRAGEAVFAYDYRDNRIPGQKEHYWRDVGTVSGYHEANMDLVQYEPQINLYNEEWPIWTPADNLPGAKFVKPHPRFGCGERFIVSGGCIVEGTYLCETILGRNVRVYGSKVCESVICAGVHIAEGCSLKRVIVDEGVYIPAKTKIGFDSEHDKARGFSVDESGIVIVPQGYIFK